MRYQVTYFRTLVNEEGNIDYRRRDYIANAIDMQQVIDADKEFWNFYREPGYVEELECSTPTLATVQTFLDREMPFLKPY